MPPTASCQPPTNAERSAYPLVLSIAGSDSSCGAGLQADTKTIAALGGYALNVVTAVVSEVPGKVSRIELMPSSMIEDQLQVLCSTFPIAAAKTGMIGGEAQLRAIIDAISGPCAEAFAVISLVVDPVMVATSGRRLLSESAMETLTSELLPRATLVTPNMDEAAVLWGQPVRTVDDMARCAQALSERYGTAVLVKGGHLTSNLAADVLCDGGTELQWFESERVAGVKTHGTGCAYSAAIATGLAHLMTLPEAIAQAKAFITRAIAQHHLWHSPQGGVQALHHFAS